MRTPAAPPDPRPHDAPSRRWRAAERLLDRAEHLLRSQRNRTANLARADAVLREGLALPLTDAQLLRARRLTAQLCDAHCDSAEAVDWATKGIALAEARGDRCALVDLLVVRGKHQFYQLRLCLAARDYERCLPLIRDLRTAPDEHKSLAIELYVLVKLAGWHYMMGSPLEAGRLLEEARGVYARVPDQSVNGIVIDYTEALLELWRGNPEKALKPASAAAGAYSRARIWNTAARIHITSATAYLDLAAGFDSVADRRTMIGLARHHHHRAVVMATRAHDQNAHALATILNVRINRMAARQDDWENILSELVARGESSGDFPLVAQALTALGDAYLAADDEERAITAYTRVMEVLAGTDFIALGVAAHRALAHYDEHHVDEADEPDEPDEASATDMTDE